jgi:cytochrome P450
MFDKPRSKQQEQIMPSPTNPVPTIDNSNSLPILKALARERSLLAGLGAMQKEMGNIFAITMPGFQPIVLAGSGAAHELLVSKRGQFSWRVEKDPVARLLRHGVLVEDGDSHDRLRSYMQPALKRSEIQDYLPAMLDCCDRVILSWEDGKIYDMLDEMRKLALMILMESLFSVDIQPDLERLWQPILRVLKYISPGLWIVKPEFPRPGYQASIDTLDEYLYGIIRERRLNPAGHDDMLSDLISKQDMDDDLIRDQMLTMLIAGHDTSTALLAWVLYLLAVHPEIKKKAQEEVDLVLRGDLPTSDGIAELNYLDQIIKETLRLYPPIHAANRVAEKDVDIQGCPVEQGRRVMFSYYLTHRDQQVWEDPERFDPTRFNRDAENKVPAFSYLPFGGGPRNCIGAAFAQSESKIILARFLQVYDLELVDSNVHVHMGATLEPRPGVRMRVSRRENASSTKYEDLMSDRNEAQVAA